VLPLSPPEKRTYHVVYRTISCATDSVRNSTFVK
jgi:hypothetical protein